MPTYEIQGPDGKTYSIDGPEGASREEVIAAIQARMQAQPAAPKAEAPKPAAPTPKKAEQDFATTGAMGEDLGSAIMSEADGLGVMSGYTAATPVKTPSKAPLRPEVRAALENKYNEATPKERKKLAAAPGAVGDVFRQQAQEDERAKKLPEATQRLNPRAEFDATRVVEPSDTAESIKGVKSGISGLQSTWEGLGAAKDVGVALNKAKALDLFDKIDSGALDKSTLTPDVAGGDMSPIFRDAAVYLNSNEAKRKELRDRATNEIQNRKDFVDAAVKTIQRYQEENKANKGRTENLTDAQSIADFTDWVAFNLGSGAVQLVPIMLAAVTTGPAGALAVGTGMELGGQTQNRINFIVNKLKDEKDPKVKADALFDYVQKSNDLNLAAAIASGVIDATLGPAARLAKEPLREIVREKTRLAIAKAAAKAIPADMLEEGVAGGLQETISIAAERALEEQGGDAFSEKNIKRVVDSLAAEAIAGGGAGAGAGVVKTIKGPTTPVVPEPLAGTTETAGTTDQTQAPSPVRRPTLGGLQAANKTELQGGEPGAPPLSKLEAARNPSLEVNAPPPVAPPAAPPADPRLNALVQAYVSKGYMQDDAQRLAQTDLAAISTPPDVVIQQAKQKEDAAVATAMQSLGGQNATTPNAEPPPHVTEPSTDQFSAGMFGAPSETTGGTPSPIANGLATAERLIGAVTNREERERTALEQQHQQIERRLAKAFNQQPFPNLAPIFGLGWQQQTMASNPTAEQFQEAAYAKLEDLGFLGQRAEGTVEPTTIKETPSVTEAPKTEQTKEKGQEEPAAKPAAPAVKVGFRAPTKRETDLDRADAALDFGNGASAVFSGIDGDVFIKGADGKEIGSVRYYDNRQGSFQTVEEIPEVVPEPLRQPLLDYNVAAYADSKLGNEESKAAKKAAQDKIIEAVQKLNEEPTVDTTEELPLLSTRNEALELSGDELDAYNAMVQSRAELARVEQSHEKAAKTRAPGGGRKPSENKRTDQERNEQAKAINQFYRDVKTLLGFAEQANQRQAPETFKSEQEWVEKEEKRAQSLKTLQKVIYRESLKYGTTKAHAALKDYVRNMPEAQLAEAKAAVLAERGEAKKSRVSTAESAQEHSTKVNPELKQFSSLMGALSYIGMSGNFVDSGIARVLLDEKNRQFTKDVTFMVVEKDDPSIPNDVKELLEDSNGAYAPFQDREGGIVYIAGQSFGHTGLNNITVLHEGVHAVTTSKLLYVEDAIAAGETSKLDSGLAEAYKELQDLMKSTYEALVTYRGPLQSKLDELVGFGVFEDAHEFLTYGMTDPAMKEFLRTTVPGTSTKTSGFDKLVEIIMRVLGVDPSLKSGLKDLVLISNQIMEAEVSPQAMREMATKADAEINDVVKAMRKSDQEVEKEYAKLKDSPSSKQKLSILGNIGKISRDPASLGRLLVAKWNRLSLKDLRDTGVLKVMPTDELIKRGTELGIGSLNAITDTVGKLAAFRIKMLRQVSDIKDNWIKLKEQDAKNLADAMHFTTLVGIDPTKDTSNKRVNAVWKSLSKEAKAVYVEVRDWYANKYRLYGQYLQERVDSVAGNAEEKNALMASIRVMLEAGSKLSPYFPLMRYGQYWTRIGKGENAIFAMFEDSDSRDAFVREKMAELAARGDTRSRERMFEDNSLDEGNSLEELKDKLPEHNETIKKMFETIDNMTSVDKEAKNELKQEVFQMHLNTMPDESFRKQFLHREGKAGFSNDALRNFVTLGSKLTNQLGRIKYGPQLTNNVSAARASLKGNPDKAKLGMIVDRLEARVNEEISPSQLTPFEAALSPIMSGLTKTAFLWQMSGVKSAVTQMFSLVTHGLPVLWNHHGIGRSTTQALFDVASMGFGLVGKLKTAPDGSIKYEFPSLKNSLGRGDPVLTKAYQAFEDSELGEMTRTADLMARTKVPTGEYSTLGKNIENGLTFFFHTGERMSREIMFIASVKLNYRKLKKDNKLTEAEKIDRAISNAMAETKEALFDYSKFNTPEAMRPVPLQTVLQYRKFQLFSAVYLMRNARAMLSDLPAKERVGAAKALFGTLGMTALIGGVPATWGYGMTMALIQGLINLMHDDDKEMPLELLNFKKYFENVVLPQKFGPEVGNAMAHGLLDITTGYDMGKGVSQDFWFRDNPEATNWKEAWSRVLADTAGPAGGMVGNWMTAIDEYNKGHYVKTWENLVPALFRGIVTDIRYSQEGVHGAFGDIIKDKNKFTDFQYFMQALGYKTAPLAQKMADNFAINQIRKHVETTRKSLVSKMLDADEVGTTKDFNKVLDQIDRFNAMYPDRTIEDKDVNGAFKHREKMLKETERGLYLPEEYDRLHRLTRESNRALREESAK